MTSREEETDVRSLPFLAHGSLIRFSAPPGHAEGHHPAFLS